MLLKIKPAILILLGVFYAVIYGGCQSESGADSRWTDEQTLATVEDDSLDACKYEGVIPCADCSGIKTELLLKRTGAGGRDFFRLSETYIGRGNVPVVTTGEWTFERGHAQDEDATVIVLVEDSLGSGKREIRYEIILSDGSAIRLLDLKRRPIRSELNYSLVLTSGLAIH